MDLGVLLESPQCSQSSTRVGACTCAFLPSCSSSVTLPFAWIKGSGAFPRGFPTRLSHESFPQDCPTRLSHEAFPQGCASCHPWCESILGLKVEAVQGKQVSLEWTETSGGLFECGTTLEFLSTFLWRAPPLELRPNAGTSFPTTQGKDPSSRARRRKQGSYGCGRDSRASSRLETGMSVNFLGFSKGVNDPMEVPELRCD